MRSLKKLMDERDESPSPSPEKAAAPDISPPIIDSERAEERIYEEAKHRGHIVSGVRRGLKNKK
jgi:hypothetical protein